MHWIIIIKNGIVAIFLISTASIDRMEFTNEKSIHAEATDAAAPELPSAEDRKPEEVVSVEESPKSIEDAMVAKEEGNR